MAGEKLDDEIDFNQMTLGDVVTEDHVRKNNIGRLKSDLFPENDSAESKIKVVEDKTIHQVSSVEKGEEFVEKYKNKTAIGSDDINSHSSSYRKDLSKFEGKSGFGSDDLSSKPKTSSSNSRLY